MGIYAEKFITSNFNTRWQSLRELTDEIQPESSWPNDVKSEFRRFKSAIAMYDARISNTDMEVTPHGPFNNQANTLGQVRSYLLNFSTTNDLTNIRNANSYLDNALLPLYPILNTGKGAAIAAGAAFRKLRDTLEAESSATSVAMQDNAKRVTDIRERVEDDFAPTLTAMKSIMSFEEEIYGTDGDTLGLEARFAQTEDGLRATVEKVQEYHEKLTKGDEEEASIIKQIDDARVSAESSAQKLTSKLSAVSESTDELRRLFDKVVGAVDENGTRSDGLDERFEKARLRYEIYEREQRTKISELLTESKKVLSASTTAALATSFNTQKESYNKNIKTFTLLFYGSLVGIFFASIGAYVEAVSLEDMSMSFKSSEKLGQVFSLLLTRAPFVAPFGLLAYFALKRRAENRRLQEEYAHKESVMLSYESFVKQAEGLGDSTILAQLLAAAITVISTNPVAALDKNKGEGLASTLSPNQLNQIQSFLKLAGIAIK